MEEHNMPLQLGGLWAFIKVLLWMYGAQQVLSTLPTVKRAFTGEAGPEERQSMMQIAAAKKGQESQAQANRMMMQWLQEREVDNTLSGLMQSQMGQSEWLRGLGQTPLQVPRGPEFPTAAMPPFSLTGILGIR
jgi:hypothetical protein